MCRAGTRLISGLVLVWVYTAFLLALLSLVFTCSTTLENPSLGSQMDVNQIQVTSAPLTLVMKAVTTSHGDLFVPATDVQIQASCYNV